MSMNNTTGKTSSITRRDVDQKASIIYLFSPVHSGVNFQNEIHQCVYSVLNDYLLQLFFRTRSQFRSLRVLLKIYACCAG